MVFWNIKPINLYIVFKRSFLPRLSVLSGHRTVGSISVITSPVSALLIWILNSSDSLEPPRKGTATAYPTQCGLPALYPLGHPGCAGRHFCTALRMRASPTLLGRSHVRARIYVSSEDEALAASGQLRASSTRWKRFRPLIVKAEEGPLPWLLPGVFLSSIKPLTF